MATQDTDLLLIQRGNVPYKETAADFADYIENTIDFPTFEDPIVFQGLWSDHLNPPADPEAGYLWIWDGTRQELDNGNWGDINGEDITVNDRIYHNGEYLPAVSLYQLLMTRDLGYTAANDKGTVTISNGTNAEIPLVDDTNAGLMSPTDKVNLDNITASPGGVISIAAGDGILVDTTVNGSAGAPEVSANFGAVRDGQNPVTVMPYDISMLERLPS